MAQYLQHIGGHDSAIVSLRNGVNQTMPRPDPQSGGERWKPAENEPYFIILGDGSVKMLSWHGTPFDHGAWEFGNCFREHRQALRARDAIKEVLRGRSL